MLSRFVVSGLTCLALGACGGQASPPAPGNSALARSSASALASTVSSGTASPATVRIAYQNDAASFAPLWIAQDKGLFKNNGLDTQVTSLTGQAPVQGLTGGSLEMADVGNNTVQAIASGANLTYIAETTQFYGLALYGGPSVQKVGDLIGHTVGVPGVKGGGPESALMALLSRESVDVSKVQILYMAGASAALAALQTNSVQAAMLTSPDTLRARQAGLRLVVDMIPLKIHSIGLGLVVRKDWAQQHQDVVQSVLKAYLQGVKEYRTSPDSGKAAISKWLKLDDTALVDESYATSAPNMPAYPLSREADFQDNISRSADDKVKAHKPSDFYDNSYLQGLESFANGLWPDGIPTI